MSQSGLPHDVVEYPCSDGQPMGESDIHIDCIMYVCDALKWCYETRGRADAYVSANSFLYYEQGNPRAVVAPDVYVVLGAPGHLRDSYLLWNEPKGPDFVLEVTSASTRREDERRKRAVYASLGVSEYFLYDPRGEYLTPALQGYRLRDGEYRTLPAVTVLPDRGVAVHSEVLGLEFRDVREERMLRLHDPETGQDFLTYREEAAARRAAQVRLDQEAAARNAVEARNARRVTIVQLPVFAVDLHEAARRSESETSEWIGEKLDESIERYRKFFALARSGERVAPTRDIDMIWHLHMLAPVAYHNDCTSYLGRILDHDGGFGQTPQEAAVLAEVFMETSRRWEEVFGEPYVAEMGGETKCWHDCVNRCWHACKSVSAPEVSEPLISA